MKHKRNISLIKLFILAFLFSSYSAKCVHVSGRYILGECGDTITLYGVNYAAYDWGYSASENFFPEIAKTGANAVRIQWYAFSNLSVYKNLNNLDSAIARAIRYKMIPVVVLQNMTCDPMDSLNRLLSFYKQKAFLNIESKYRKSLIINISNETGYYSWASASSADMNKYKNGYINFVDSLRKYGIKSALMIDAPDGGSNSDVVVSVGGNILSADNEKNVIFSIHGYWYSFANNDSTTMAKKVTALYQSGLPVVFGEIANNQDGNTPGQYTLNYKPLLHILKKANIGWLAWCWTNDNSATRQMTSNGLYSNLGVYGKYIVNDVQIGISKNAKKALNFTRSCSASYAADEVTGDKSISQNNNQFIKLYPNPANHFINFDIDISEGISELAVYNSAGRQMFAKQIQSAGYRVIEQMDISNFPAGLYFVQVKTSDGASTGKFIKN